MEQQQQPARHPEQGSVKRLSGFVQPPSAPEAESHQEDGGGLRVDQTRIEEERVREEKEQRGPGGDGPGHEPVGHQESKDRRKARDEYHGQRGALVPEHPEPGQHDE